MLAVYSTRSSLQVANIIFVDSPVGTGFSFSRDPEAGYELGDISSSSHLYNFLTKIDPILAHLISQDIHAGKQPLFNLKVCAINP
ncbi:hypothetical protein B296_00030013 [Ensete ventricosum]|uniref:Uncharacterized protein n=1 Tax=Ensete ventricosum TaxID=4639 RepID=A0A426Z582_ENSVE|nr:hypothetical protein B296_00030013 [Ensete ventricosum]